MSLLGIGVDLVHIPSIDDQLSMPGTRFASVFTAGERREVRGRPDGPAPHLAARWAAKEAVIKAWSASVYGGPPLTGGDIHNQIEVINDAWGRPAIGVRGRVAELTAGATFKVSLSHDGDYAIAYVAMVADDDL